MAVCWNSPRRCERLAQDDDFTLIWHFAITGVVLWFDIFAWR
jgi:hypothetical protein